MEADYIIACGIVWRKTADLEAGWELLVGLQSEDKEIRFLAQTVLAESGEAAMDLVETALAGGILTPERAGSCMEAILRSQNCIEDWVTGHQKAETLSPSYLVQSEQASDTKGVRGVRN